MRFREGPSPLSPPSPAAAPARLGPTRGDAVMLALATCAAAALLSGAPMAIPLAVVLVLGLLVLAILRFLPPHDLAVVTAEDGAASGPDVATLIAERDHAEADSAAKSRRLATAGHEIRTPLHGILGMADLLAETALSPEQTSYVRAIRTSGAALLGLVDDVLDLARLEAGRLALAPEPVDLQALVEDVVELLAPRAQGKGLELASIVAPGLARRVEADPILLRQVLINLAGNAVKFTRRGGVALEVEPATADAAGRILFRVRDTGLGIADDDVDRIFGEFEQVDPTAAPRGGGSGLGLAIARTLVARMGGELRLTSRLGEGSVFSFDLWLPPIEGRDLASPPLAGRRVALLSDGVVEPPLLLRRLHALGADAVQLRDPSGFDGTARFDVVLIDGDDHAGDRLAVLKAQRSDLAPAVVMITPSDRARLAELRRAGFAAHLVKPVRAASLARVVAALGAGEGLDEPAEGSAPPPSPGTTAGLDLLLADDNEINALLGRALLQSLGHRVTVVADGTAAVEAIAAARGRGRPFAGVLMDLHMPGMDGFAAIRALRLAESGAADRLAIIALTADGTAAAAMRARACGADATLVKPIERDRLAAVLASFAPLERLDASA